MSDLISRKAAIDAINHICPVDTEYDCTLLDRVDVRYVLSDLPSAQPELIEKAAYIRGFEQGRTQGMIDSQGGKMNKQRKVLITITYNEMGIIIDTKAEEVAQPNLQPTCNQLATDTISRQAAIDAAIEAADSWDGGYNKERERFIRDALEELPSAQLTLCGYNIKHLELIARILQKEDLQPENIAEVLSDIGRIVAIIKDEFEETLRKAAEQCTI